MTGYIEYVRNMNPDQRFTMAIRNIKRNYSTISHDVGTFTDDWNVYDYFGSGEEAEIISHIVFPAPTGFLQ
jgi:hypothetical protein